MSIARLFGMRSTCPRAQVGVVAVTDGRIVGSGYVGAPTGLPHCTEAGCIMENGGCVRSVHAEANLIAWAAREGISLYESTIYCTHGPCFSCAKLLANAGIENFTFSEDYRDERGVNLLRELEVVVTKYDDYSESTGESALD
jgi:dCMP deaminase